jgi:hypothetical protein
MHCIYRIYIVTTGESFCNSTWNNLYHILIIGPFRLFRLSCNFFYLVFCEAIGTAATSGLLCRPRLIANMIVEKQMGCTLAGETEVLGENLPQRHFCPSQNPTWPYPTLNPGRRAGKPATNRLIWRGLPYYLALTLNSTTPRLGILLIDNIY